jgi:hypothetical protein
MAANMENVELKDSTSIRCDRPSFISWGGRLAGVTILYNQYPP